MRVIIAEKPSVGRSIAAALSLGGRAGEGYLEGREVIVTWCFGHLVGLADPEDYNPEWKHWSLNALPLVPDECQFQVYAKSKAQFAIIKRLLARPDVTDVVNACDSGREGELIFDLVFTLAGCKKPVVRLWTPSLTDEAIRTAYSAMKPASTYRGLRDAARSRQEADWLVGINATRAQTLVARSRGGQGVFSIGRVQTPTLALLVRRELAIRTFVSRHFWTVRASFATPRNAVYAGDWCRRGAEDQRIDRFDNKTQAEALVARLAGHAGRIHSVEKREVARPPEQLYDLTTLQREANRRFGYSAQKTLSLAQALYEEDKVLSYPRTNSRYLTKDVAVTLPALLRHLAKQELYAPFLLPLFERPVPPLGRRFVDDTKVEDHHALLPTGRSPQKLASDAQHLYDLVVRRLIGAHLPDLREAKTTAITRILDETFESRGTVVIAPGWTVVDPVASPKKVAKASQDLAEPSSLPLPLLVEGASVAVTQLQAKPGKTQAPKRYTEGDLLGAMETSGKDLEDAELREAMRDNGLGTPATRAAILETLLDREYAVREKKALVPTEKGITLIEALAVPELASAELTGQWEAQLARMARGQHDRTTFRHDVVAFVNRTVDQIRARPSGTTQVAPSVSTTQTSSEPPRPVAPSPVPCSCGHTSRVVWSTSKQKWFLRCDACARWLSTPSVA
jgi:DNA topoisomerase-3